MDKITDSLAGILSAGTTGLVLKLALIFLSVAGLGLLAWFRRKTEAEKARQEEAAKELRDKQNNIGDNVRENEEAKTDSGEVDDFLTK